MLFSSHNVLNFDSTTQTSSATTKLGKYYRVLIDCKEIALLDSLGLISKSMAASTRTLYGYEGIVDYGVFRFVCDCCDLWFDGEGRGS
jgi:hypothetical protein